MKRLIAFTFMFFSAALAAVVSGAVYAQESDTFTLPPEYVAQMPLSNAAGAIQNLVRDNSLAGFGGLRLDNDNHAVLLHWKGTVPAQISNYIAGSAVTITVVNVPYSRTELIAEIDRIRQTPRIGDVKLINIGTNRTFDGIDIGINTDGDQTDAAKIAAGKAAFTSTIPLKFEVAEPLIPFRDRWDDEEPFYGGAQMDHQTHWLPPRYAYCTAGFSVTRDDGSEGMLTAAHCEHEDGWDWNTPDGDIEIGYHSSTSSCSTGGGVLIGETYEDRVYRGNWESGSNAHVLSTHEDAVLDEYVFVSGGSSGQHMVKVDEIDHYEWVGNYCGTTVGPGFSTTDEQDDGSVGEGDSGGPVYKYIGANDVKPKGIIQAGYPSTEEDCEGWQGPSDDPRVCTSRSFHSNIGAILDRLDLTLQ